MIEHIIVCNSEAPLWATCEELLRDRVSWVESVERRAGIFVSGGATFVPFYERVGDIDADIFLTDERMVPAGSSLDTGAMLEREWMSRLIAPQARLNQIHRQGDAPTTAFTYEQQIRDWQAKGGVWAAALLGVGEDGHTASLFPGQHALWQATPSLVVPAEGEHEPFVPRVSVSPTLFSQVPCHIVVLTGSAKAEIARKWLREREKLPVEYVQPSEDRYVLLDYLAARDLDPASYERV